MKRSTQRKVIRITVKLIPYVAVIALGIAMVKTLVKSGDLNRNFSFSSGTIIKFADDYRGAGGRVTYIYKVEGKEYKNVRGYPTLVTSKGYLLEGKNFPVVFDTHDTTNSYMLITPNDFKKYGVSFPDSLDWVKGYVKSY